MGDISFGSTISMLNDALQGATATQGAVANNIANVNTPEFRRTDVSFKDSLAALEPRSDEASDDLAMTIDNARMIPESGPQAGGSQTFSVTSTVDDTQQMRVDGSNVDIDQEMAKLSLNSAYQQTMSQLLTNSYGRLRKAITDQA
ncbi:MAG: flagellar basal body rod protein FlgB [Actinobacteria bacterium]|nr:flagellar basal body rod protein FlgB [Actinomycetota bacterium]